MAVASRVRTVPKTAYVPPGDGRVIQEPGPGPLKADRPQQHPKTEDLRAGAAREPDHDPAREAPRVRTRRRKSTVFEDMFYLPVDEIPPDTSYEWKRWSNVGEENPFYIAQMREQGWEPVPASRHPSWVPPGYDKPFIIKGGQILMDRPMSLTLEARAESKELAQRQVREAEQRLGKTGTGEMTRDHDGVRPKVVKEMMRAVPIEE